eukprot:Nk52_evm69s745 gene=Nk52_evmTU69s745
MASQEEKALEYIRQAEKKAKSGGGFLSSVFGGGSNKNEEAAELFIKAANCYKMLKKWGEAGDCFTQAAELFMKDQNKHEASNTYKDAASAYKKVNIKVAVKSLQSAIDILTDTGRFSRAAKLQSEIAELYEQDEVDLEQAMEAYQLAADWHQAEEANSEANKCLLKVAQYAGQLQKYDKGIEIYETIGTAAIDNSLLKWSAKDYFFKAGILHMCQGDLITAQRALERYGNMFPSFQDSRECKLLVNLLGAWEEQNLDDFTQCIADYDNISRLDAWVTSMLLRVKNGSFGEEESLT